MVHIECSKKFDIFNILYCFLDYYFDMLNYILSGSNNHVIFSLYNSDDYYMISTHKTEQQKKIIVLKLYLTKSISKNIGNHVRTSVYLIMMNKSIKIQTEKCYGKIIYLK